ncbi:hypothetical protein OKW22_000868 [Bacilli bacterium PM5-3]|nr:hypothetical protein [Bacilli bacterium PM5-3]
MYIFLVLQIISIGFFYLLIERILKRKNKNTVNGKIIIISIIFTLLYISILRAVSFNSILSFSENYGSFDVLAYRVISPIIIATPLYGYGGMILPLVPITIYVVGNKREYLDGPVYNPEYNLNEKSELNISEEINITRSNINKLSKAPLIKLLAFLSGLMTAIAIFASANNDVDTFYQVQALSIISVILGLVCIKLYRNRKEEEFKLYHRLKEYETELYNRTKQYHPQGYYQGDNYALTFKSVFKFYLLGSLLVLGLVFYVLISSSKKNDI